MAESRFDVVGTDNSHTLRHDLKLGCELAVCRVQLHCTITTTLNTCLTAMCPALCVLPFAKATVIVLQGVETVQSDQH